MNNVQTEHSFLETKIQLRIDNLPAGKCRVLDCFAGESLIWDSIKEKLPDRKIDVLSIEQKRHLGVSYLQGDNIKFLSSMDLYKFNVLDLDAYGVPYRQLKVIFLSKLQKNTIVFVTFIQSVYGKLPFGMLVDLGYSISMIRKCPALFCRDGLNKFTQFLAINGINQIKRFSFSNRQKNYICFRT